MGERSEELYYEEDLERVRKVTSSGYNSVERKPFRPLKLLLVWWIVVSVLGVVSYYFAHNAGVV